MFARFSRVSRLCRFASVANFASTSLVAERLKRWNDLHCYKNTDLQDGNKSITLTLNDKQQETVKQGTCPQQLVRKWI